MRGIDIAKLVSLPIAFFIALLLVGATVVSEHLTIYGSPANVLARTLGFLLSWLFIAYLALLAVGFGLAYAVRGLRSWASWQRAACAADGNPRGGRETEDKSEERQMDAPADVTTREEIDAAFKQWGSVREAQWPAWLREPKMEHHFNLCLLLTLARQYPDAWGKWMGPEYDEKGHLTAIRGIQLKGSK